MNTLKFKTKRLLFVLVFMLMMGTMLPPAGAIAAQTKNEVQQLALSSENRSAEIRNLVDQSINKATEYYKSTQPAGNNSHNDYWLFSALWGANENLKDFPWKADNSPWDEGKFWTTGKNAATSTSNEDAGIIIGSILLGQDPRQFGERDIVQDLIDKQKENGSFFTIWGESWAMIALDLAEADYDREKHLEYILKQQSNGTFGDVDANGWILTALAPYMNERADVKIAVELAVQTVNDGYKEKGEISGQWGADGNSTAAILMGLVASGEDLYSDKWTKDGKSIVEQFIETYQQENGSFWWKKDTAGAVGMVTEQSLLALSTISKGDSIFVHLKNDIKPDPEQTTNVTVQVEGMNGPLYAEQSITTEIGTTVLDALKQALDKAKITYKITETSLGSYVSAINGEVGGSLGGWDGWNYFVNGESPNIGADVYELKDGDQVQFFYSRWAKNASDTEIKDRATNPTATVTLVGDTFSSGAIKKSNWTIRSNDTGLEIDTIRKETNQKVTITFKGTAQIGTLSITALAGALDGKKDSDEAASIEVVKVTNIGSCGVGSQPSGQIGAVQTTDQLLAPQHLTMEVKDGKIRVFTKDVTTGEKKPVQIENCQTVGGYLVVQVGAEDVIYEDVYLPSGAHKVVILDNDKRYEYFDADANTKQVKEWKVSFSQPFLDEASNLEKVTVQDASGNNVEIKVTLSKDGKTVIITPDIPYKKGELYYMTIADAKSASGKIQTTPVRKIFVVEQ